MEEEKKEERGKFPSTAPETHYRSNEDAISNDSNLVFPLNSEEVLKRFT
jgi:hypothetical protein